MIKDEFKSFVNFLFEKNIFQVGISFIIATQTKTLSSKIIETLIFPLIVYFLGENFDKKETKIGKIKIKTGILLKASIEFILIMLFIYYLYKLSQPKGFFDNVTNTVYGFF